MTRLGEAQEEEKEDEGAKTQERMKGDWGKKKKKNQEGARLKGSEVFRFSLGEKES